MEIDGNVITLEDECMTKNLLTTPETTLIIKGEVELNKLTMQGGIKMTAGSELFLSEIVLNNVTIIQPNGQAELLHCYSVTIKDCTIQTNITTIDLTNTTPDDLLCPNSLDTVNQLNIDHSIITKQIHLKEHLDVSITNTPKCSNIYPLLLGKCNCLHLRNTKYDGDSCAKTMTID